MSLDTRYRMIDNYIYLYHIDTLIVVPTFTESVNDTLSANFSQEFPLARSAPIYSYSNSGPRTIQFQFDLHRNLMNEINYGISNAPVDNLTDDYVDFMIKAVQASVLPSYDSANKTVSPPIVAVRLGSDIFIKGVVNSGVSVSYSYPILDNGKYASVKMQLSVSEIDPYQAKDVVAQGSYRGLSSSLERFTYQDLYSITSRNYITGRQGLV